MRYINLHLHYITLHYITLHYTWLVQTKFNTSAPLYRHDIMGAIQILLLLSLLLSGQRVRYLPS